MPKRNLIWILAILATAGLTLWVTRHRPRPEVGAPNLGEFAPALDTYVRIREKYYHPLAGRELARGAVEGMVGALDEFSSYIAPDRMGPFSHRVMGHQRGLGMEIEQVGPQVLVVGLMPGSPAHAAGVTIGDRLLAVDAKGVSGRSPAEVESLLAGELGEEVTLTLLTPTGETRNVTVEREEFDLETVEGLYRDRAGRWRFNVESGRPLAYVRIEEFVPGTIEEFRAAWRRVESSQGLILDLRDNPGGLLPSAVELVNLFVRKGRIVTVLERDAEPKEHVARPEDTYPPKDLLVLVDEHTASAAELTAGALQHHDRAVVLGWRTRGKGCIQQMLPVGGGLGFVNLTISEFRVAPRRSITRTEDGETWGIEPDVKVEVPSWRVLEIDKLRRKLSALPPRRPQTRPSTGVVEEPKHLARRLIKLDPQLDAAVELLGNRRRFEATLDAAARARRRAAATAPSGEGARDE